MFSRNPWKISAAVLNNPIVEKAHPTPTVDRCVHHTTVGELKKEWVSGYDSGELAQSWRSSWGQNTLFRDSVMHDDDEIVNGVSLLLPKWDAAGCRRTGFQGVGPHSGGATRRPFRMT